MKKKDNGKTKVTELEIVKLQKAQKQLVEGIGGEWQLTELEHGNWKCLKLGTMYVYYDASANAFFCLICQSDHFLDLIEDWEQHYSKLDKDPCEAVKKALHGYQHMIREAGQIYLLNKNLLVKE